jgi:hypothetical protein
MLKREGIVWADKIWDRGLTGGVRDGSFVVKDS